MIIKNFLKIEIKAKPAYINELAEIIPKRMKQTLTTILFVLTVVFHSTAQTDTGKFYKEAFAEQLQMLEGQKPISFKRAVF